MENRISRRSFLAAAAVSAAAAAMAGCSGKKSREITNITVWNYYNGDQLESFNKLLSTFNDTIGREQNIHVEGSSQGTVNDLETNVMEAAEGKVGAAAMPNIFSAYADTAYALDQMGLVVDLNDYLTAEEKQAFVPSYVTEGDFDGNGSMKIFPVAKSTELLFLNDTDWEKFSADTGVTYADLATIEGVTRAAELYYDWSDGKALFGRDAMANYILEGARQLGCTIFDVRNGKMTLHFDHDVVRKLWDNYYVPFVKGHFAASGHFRSDDVKTGSILGYVGSCSSATFFPKRVMLSDTQVHDIEMKVLPAPRFTGGKKVVVQQGAGMVVTTGTEAEIKASVTFLKWFTMPENNIAFSVESGYLPVTTAANDMAAIRASGLQLSKNMEQILDCAVQTVQENTLYTPGAFADGNAARKVLDYGLSDLAAADRDTVLERMAAGQSAEKAMEEFLTDAYFEAWYQDIRARLEQYEG